MIAFLTALAFLSAPARPDTPSPERHHALETMAANDGRRAAGTPANGVLTVHLEARMGTWYPEGPLGVGVETAGWSEVGRPLENPGPAIRVTAGTVVKASLHNAQTYDPEVDRVIMVSDAGPATNVVSGPYPSMLLNGSEHPAPLQFQAGRHYRLRVLGITGDLPVELTLGDGVKLMRWRAVARDGMDLPASQATVRPAHLMLDPGQIYDFELAPTTPGTFTLRYGIAPVAAPPGYKQASVEVRVTRGPARPRTSTH